jgi:hypothetical protein
VIVGSYVSFSGLLLLTRDFDQPFKSQQVAAPAHTDDMPLANRGHQGLMAKLLARVNIAQMHFDNGRFHSSQRIAQRDRIVRKRPRVDDNTVRLLRLLLDKVDESSLVIRLEALNLCSKANICPNVTVP